METRSRSSHFARPGNRLLGRARSLPAHGEFGQADAAFPFPAPSSWLNILPVSSPAVLGCCSRQPFPRRPPSRARRETSSRLPGLSLEPHPQSVTFTAFSSPYQTQSTRPDRGKGVPGGPRWSRNSGVSFQGKEREREIDIYIFFFFLVRELI